MLIGTTLIIVMLAFEDGSAFMMIWSYENRFNY